jgi:hypothetical protein
LYLHLFPLIAVWIDCHSLKNLPPIFICSGQSITLFPFSVLFWDSNVPKNSASYLCFNGIVPTKHAYRRLKRKWSVLSGARDKENSSCGREIGYILEIWSEIWSGYKYGLTNTLFFGTTKENRGWYKKIDCRVVEKGVVVNRKRESYNHLSVNYYL